MYGRFFLLVTLGFLLGWTPLVPASDLLPSRNKIDGWLNKLGANSRFDTNKTVDWGVIPGPFYTPELGLGLGAAVAGIYRPDKSNSQTQNSTISLSGYVGARGAVGITVQNYSFLADDDWRFFLDGSLNNTPTYYWGQGFSAGKHNGNKQRYTSREFTLRPELFRKIAPALWAGVGLSFASEHAARIENKGTGPLVYAAGGASTDNVGASLSVDYDTRDFVPNPRHGQMARLRYTHYSPEMGGNARFDEYEARYGLYRSIAANSVLAWEVDGHFTQGDVPWTLLPALGGDRRMRGYYEGRYRDRNVVSSQLEYRRKLDWRHGIVGWIGSGTMSERMSKLGAGEWLPSMGVGYRFEFKPRMNVRLDYGIGKRSSGFYFQVGEAF
ncbi:BamA/TamA family outer membrane protein [Serratia ureilytica]|uniref:BamA/TamA family outer membrane protein n=1 Tax=Serratia ureilytica TaxID=300181 RepID=UPI001D18018E|nr:BamA/TamA family outer membrane protein [Serratia ureilytica]MCC4108133.1 BamA/TamA family outer membrane protein [Serratia ureilytica]